MRGDAGCLQCHPAFADALEEHTHHPAGSEGSRCYNCHMPNTVYGMLKATRDHEVRSPSAQETLASGRPNACNLCHLDRTLEWTSQQLESWYGIEPPEITDPEHQRTALGPLQLLRGNAVQRAFIAWHMGWDPAREASGEDWIPPLLAQLLEDPYPAVRQIADRSLRSIEGYEEIGFDALSSSDERSLGRWRVWETWEKARRSRPRNGHGDAVLLDPDGLPQMERLNRLLSQRDDRFLYLEE
jgi:hypothetical protein